MVTKHTSTNLEEINKKIARLLKDPADALNNTSINVDEMSLHQLKEFAENGGLGACVSKVDVLASTSDELMYLQGERIIILKHVENDIYKGYCEGVIGNFNAETVHFVELDPRVLESLDADIDTYQYQDSSSSLMTDSQRQSHFTFRDSLQSYSSGSDHHPYSMSQQSVQNHHYYTTGQTNWATKKKSFESEGTFSNKSLLHPPEDISDSEDPYDTSALNVNYSDDETDQDFVKPALAPPPPPSKKAVTPLPAITSQKKPVKQSIPAAMPSLDEFGFILSSKTTPNTFKSTKSMKEYREHELKWIAIMNKSDAHSVKKDAKFKKLVRYGIPASVRARVWQFLSGSQVYQQRSQHTFQSYLDKPSIAIYQVIERDIARCYPDHSQFMDPEGQGQKDLSNVLRAYAQYNPQLEYCQGMGRLAGLMLMHMTVEDSFWLLVATIDKYMNGYFTPTLSQLRIDAYIIGQLLKDQNPKLAQHLENNDVLPIMYIAQWFLTAFTMTLPWESVLRVWDAFYFEGIKVFYRVSLAILEVCKDHLLNQCPTNSELLAFMLHIPHSYLESNHLLDIAFKINLSKADIKKYAKKAGTEDTSTSGLPFEEGLKNLQVGNNNSSFLRKMSRKGSSLSFKSSD